jgi:hypothetical protein
MILTVILTLALVGGKAVTNRDVYLHMMSQPEYVSSLKNSLVEGSKIRLEKIKNLENDSIEAGLGQVLTQIMIVEDLKLVGATKISPQEVQKRMDQIRSAWGAAHWAELTLFFDLGESEFRTRIEKNMIVEAAIEERVRTAVTNEPNPEKRTQLARAALEDWYSQLRSRYKVQYLKTDSKESAGAEGSTKKSL